MFSELDSMYWVVACQTGPINLDWMFESDGRECLVADLHIPVPAFENRGVCLWQPGALSQFDGHLIFDEWSYFIGFHSSSAEAVDRAARLGLSYFFSSEFYELLAREGALFAVQVDGWWEFSSAVDSLLDRIKDCTPMREIALRSPGDIDWTPRFISS